MQPIFVLKGNVNLPTKQPVGGQRWKVKVTPWFKYVVGRHPRWCWGIDVHLLVHYRLGSQLISRNCIMWVICMHHVSVQCLLSADSEVILIMTTAFMQHCRKK